MVPVILSLASIDDLNFRFNGYSVKEIRKCKVVRIPKEAYEQGGVLNRADISQLTDASVGTSLKDIREYQIEQEEILPPRGTIHDISPRLTHKKITFIKVKKLYDEGFQVENIASDLDMSKTLVKEYVEII